MNKEEIQGKIEKIKAYTEKKQDSLNKYNEAVKEYGENSGIARVIFKSLEKAEKESDNFIIENVEELQNEKSNLEEEIKEMQEKRKLLETEKEYMESVIKRDELKNVSKTDKIQESRKNKVAVIIEQIAEIDKDISEKNDIIGEIKDFFKSYSDIEIEQEEHEKEETELVLDDEENTVEINEENEAQSKDDNVIKSIDEGIAKKIEKEMDSEKNNNIIEKTVIAQTAKEKGDNIIKQMGKDYMHVNLEPEEKTITISHNMDNRKPEVPYIEGFKLPEEQVEGLENIQSWNNKIETEPQSESTINNEDTKKEGVFKRLFNKFKSVASYIAGLFKGRRDSIKLIPEAIKGLHTDIDKLAEKIDDKIKGKKQNESQKTISDIVKESNERLDKIDRTVFVEKVDNEDGHIEKKAIEKVDSEIVPEEEYKKPDFDVEKTTVDGNYTEIKDYEREDD